MAETDEGVSLPGDSTLSGDTELDLILADYLDAPESSRFSRQELIARHPEFRRKLEAFFADAAHVERLGVALAREGIARPFLPAKAFEVLLDSKPPPVPSICWRRSPWAYAPP